MATEFREQLKERGAAGEFAEVSVEGWLPHGILGSPAHERFRRIEAVFEELFAQEKSRYPECLHIPWREDILPYMRGLARRALDSPLELATSVASAYRCGDRERDFLLKRPALSSILIEGRGIFASKAHEWREPTLRLSEDREDGSLRLYVMLPAKPNPDVAFGRLMEVVRDWYSNLAFSARSMFGVVLDYGV